ncbi:hypothetical protein SteCoe_32156 [Stentor coeruleus]|uniref:Uncharacterized protein n=1 Tax=Stentor coeruleus TaxID=5963 RepID=A0A1R2AZL8_9CILI|nr:hypothetical protein SteCoe_32156 [Stentor coeruleus]
MSANKDKDTINAKPGLASTIKGFFGRTDTNNPPPKEMKLGDTSKPVYNKEKKRWEFKGEELQETQDLAPPPKSFTTQKLSENPAKKKLYVDILASSQSEQPYKPANIEEKCDEEQKTSHNQMTKEDKNNEPLPEAENNPDPDDMFQKLEDFPIISEKEPKDRSISYELISSEDSKGKEFEKYEQKIKAMKCTEKYLRGFIEEIKENSESLLEDWVFDWNAEEKNTENLEINILNDINEKNMRIVELESLNSVANTKLALMKNKNKSLKYMIEKKDKENCLEKEIIEKQKSKLADENERLGKEIEEKDKICKDNEYLRKEIQMLVFEIEEKDKEKEIILNDLRVLIEENKDMINDREILKVANCEIKNQLDLLNEENKKISQENKEFDKRIEENDKEIGEIKNKLVESNAKCQFLLKSAGNTEVILLKFKEQTRIWQKLCEENILKVQFLEVKNVELEEKLKIKESDSVKKSASLQNKDNNDKDSQNEKWSKKCIELSESRTELMKKYKILVEEYKSVKTEFSLRIENTRNEFETKFSQLANELNNEKALNDQLKSQILLYKKELSVKDTKFKDLLTDLQYFSKLNEQHKSIIQKLQQENKQISESYYEKSAEVSELQSIIEELERTQTFQASAVLEEERKNFESTLFQVRMLLENEEKYKEQIENLEQIIESKEKIIENTNRLMMDTEKELENTKNSTESIIDELECTQKALKETQNETENYKVKILDIKLELDNLLEEYARLKNAYDDYEQEIFVLKETIKSTNQELELVNMNKNTLDKEMNHIKTLYENKNKELEDTLCLLKITKETLENAETILKENNQKIEDLQNNILSLKEQEIKLKGQIIENDEEKKKLEDKISEIAGENFVNKEQKDELERSVLEFMNEAEKEKSQMQEEIDKLKDIDTKYTQAIDELKKSKSLSIKIQNIEQEYENLLEENKNLKNQIEDFEYQNYEISQENSSFQFQIANLKEEILEKTNKLSKALEDSSKANELVMAFQDESDSKDITIQQLNEDLVEKETEIFNCKKDFESISQELFTCKKEIKEQEEHQTSIIQIHEDKITKILEESKSQLTTQGSELQALRQEYAEKVENYTTNIKKSKEKSDDMIIKISYLERKIEEKDKELAKVKSSLRTAQETLKSSTRVGDSDVNPNLLAETKKLKEKIEKLEEENAELNEDIDNYCKKNIDLQQKLSLSDITLREKEVEICKSLLRLKEKDEELVLAKSMSYEIMAKYAESKAPNCEEPEILEKDDEEPVKAEGPIKESTLQPEQASGWLSSLLSAVFLTDSERGNK